jgi:hypothetical protein
MNKQIGGMEAAHFYAEWKRRANTASDFYPDQDTHSWVALSLKCSLNESQ